MIRRVAVAGGAEREHLPEALSGGGEKINEAIRLAAEVAHAVAARQGSRMQKDAARSRKAHPFDLASFGIEQKLQQLPRGSNENQGGRSGRQTGVAGGRGRRQTAGQDFVTSLLPSAPASCRLTHGLLLMASRVCTRPPTSRAQLSSPNPTRRRAGLSPRAGVRGASRRARRGRRRAVLSPSARRRG